MIFSAAARLGIQNFAVERPEESFQVQLDDRVISVQGTKAMLEEIRSLQPCEKLSEYSKPENAQDVFSIQGKSGIRKNDHFLAQWLDKNGKSVIASDPDFLRFFGGDAEDRLDKREKATRKILANYRTPIVIQHGLYHLPVFIEQDVVVLPFVTNNTIAFDRSEGGADHRFDQYSFVPLEDAASAISAAEKKLVHLIVPGRGFDTAEKAVEITEAVDAKLGEDLARHYSTNQQEASPLADWRTRAQASSETTIHR